MKGGRAGRGRERERRGEKGRGRAGSPLLLLPSHLELRGAPQASAGLHDGWGG